MSAKRRVKISKKKKAKPRALKLRRKVLSALDLPAETDPAVSKVSIVGRGDLLMENHNGVVQCTKTVISLLVHEGLFTIKGEELLLLELIEGRAYVKGQILSVEFS